MESILEMAKAIPADSWLVLSLLSSAVVVGLHSVFAHLGESDTSSDDHEAVEPELSGR